MSPPSLEPETFFWEMSKRRRRKERRKEKELDPELGFVRAGSWFIGFPSFRKLPGAEGQRGSELNTKERKSVRISRNMASHRSVCPPIPYAVVMRSHRIHGPALADMSYHDACHEREISSIPPHPLTPTHIRRALNHHIHQYTED